MDFPSSKKEPNDAAPDSISSSQHDDGPLPLSVRSTEASADDSFSDELPRSDNWVERYSSRVASHPCLFFWISLLVIIIVGLSGFLVADISFEADYAGWETRGTTISNRATQMRLIRQNRFHLHSVTGNAAWSTLTGTDQADPDYVRRELSLSHGYPISASGISIGSILPNQLSESLLISDDVERVLQHSPFGNLLESCDPWIYYHPNLYIQSRLWPVWKIKEKEQDSGSSEHTSFLDAEVLFELCEEEARTQELLYNKGLCVQCANGEQCLPPYSLVFYARLRVPNGFSLDCATLSLAWEDQRDDIEEELNSCVGDFEHTFDPLRQFSRILTICPFGFSPLMVDSAYNATSRVQYTSSIFMTLPGQEWRLFDLVGDFARGSNLIEGVFDTQYQNFVELAVDAQLQKDLSLAFIACAVTVAVMALHTKSWLLCAAGLLQILLSFPVSCFFYFVVYRENYFPVLNFVGVFVIFALGADDLFVAVDKWKNARLDQPEASTVEVAKSAFPPAARTMFLTTLTTAVAFLGTAACPVAPLRSFAIFMSTLVLVDYILCLLMVLPVLCILDRRRQNMGSDDRRLPCSSCLPNPETRGMRRSTVHKVIRAYYGIIHRSRWFLLFIFTVLLLLSAFQTSDFKLPRSTEVRLFEKHDNQHEMTYYWRREILFESLRRREWELTYVVWGVRPGDTGDHRNPYDTSKLTLDADFEPSNEEVQVYLREFCDRLFATEFATRSPEEYQCAMNAFDEWLKEQSAVVVPEAIYTTLCGNAEGLPVAEEYFDHCIYAWSQRYEDYTVLARNGKVEIIYVAFRGHIQSESSFRELKDEFAYVDDWVQREIADFAPVGARGGFVASENFWWYDTNNALLQSATLASSIAMAVTAVVVFLFSHSVPLTLFATTTVGFVIVTSAAILVTAGWTFGFMEAILFAILIGISCDFVVHLSHAYATPLGSVPPKERNLFALITMGPSISAAAITTLASAFVMLFTIIVFFERFAVFLMLTIWQSVVGSLFFFVVVTACLGPHDPPIFIDCMLLSLRVYIHTRILGRTKNVKEIQPETDSDESLNGDNILHPTTAQEDASDDSDAKLDGDLEQQGHYLYDSDHDAKEKDEPLVQISSEPVATSLVRMNNVEKVMTSDLSPTRDNLAVPTCSPVDDSENNIEERSALDCNRSDNNDRNRCFEQLERSSVQSCHSVYGAVHNATLINGTNVDVNEAEHDVTERRKVSATPLVGKANGDNKKDDLAPAVIGSPSKQTSEFLGIATQRADCSTKTQFTTKEDQSRRADGKQET